MSRWVVGRGPARARGEAAGLGPATLPRWCPVRPGTERVARFGASVFSANVVRGKYYRLVLPHR